MGILSAVGSTADAVYSWIALPVEGQEKETKDLLDHGTSFFTTPDGFADLARIVNNVIRAFQICPAWSASGYAWEKVRLSADHIGLSLSIPAAIGNLNDMRNSALKLQSAWNLPASHAERLEKIQRVSKRVVQEGLNFTTTVGDMLNFFHQCEIVELTRFIPGINAVASAAKLVGDGWGILEEGIKLAHSRAASNRASNLEEKSHLHAKANLAMIKIARKTVSIGISTIELAAFAFAAAAAEVAVLPVVLLGLSTTLVVLGLISYLFEKNIEQNRLVSES